jgi:hypothetical protein
MINDYNNDDEKGGVAGEKVQDEKKKSLIMPSKKDFTIKEFVEFAIRQNPLVYKRLAEI